jgi:predicted CXXCH cytochrome family protein
MRTAAAVVVLATWLPAARGQGISATKHNLSVSGPGTVKSTNETQICIFCHVPHRGAGGAPAGSASYTPYASSTLVSPQPGQPSGATRICLSCHDGTIAPGGSLGRLPDGPSNVGLDLRFSHPVSFVPTATPSSARPRPTTRCGSTPPGGCSAPRATIRTSPIAIPSRRSSWSRTTADRRCAPPATSRRRGSTRRTNSRRVPSTPATARAPATPPWPTTAAGSCHRSHAAGTSSRLLDAPEPQLCLRCHDGRVAATDVSSDFAKAYVHPVLLGAAGHDAAEGPGSPTHALPETSASQARHVACSDCHDTHTPGKPGWVAGVWGIDATGVRIDPARFEYEVCFRCHADSANQPQRLGPLPPSTVRRAVIDVNLRRRFDPAAPSFHPVVAPGRSATVPGLIAPLTTGSVITCSSCHASDTGPGAGGAGPAGPHGSIYPQLLERAQATADLTVESPTAYALCYKCHDRDVLLSDASLFKPHRKHVVDALTPCSACHDAHGVSALQGNPVNNAHLIDFDVSVVQPNAQGLRIYESAGPGAGSCSLSCHGREHERTGY